MKFEQIISELKNKIYKPIYFLSGDEPYYIDAVCNYIANNVLTESEKAFNQTVVYGKDVEISDVINLSKRFPMMANHQVVIVKEAQNIRTYEEFIHYAENPLKSTILVICHKYKNFDKRKKKLIDAIKENGVFFEAKKISDYKLPDWINQQVGKYGKTIGAETCMLLSEYLGNDLEKIDNELKKLVIAIPDSQKQITIDDIVHNIGISKEYNNFELTRSLGKKDKAKATRIIHHFAMNPKAYPLPLTMAALYGYFSKLLLFYGLNNKSNKRSVAAELEIPPFVVDEYIAAARRYGSGKLIKIIGYLRDYDVKFKGVGSNTDSGELLKELGYLIMY